MGPLHGFRLILAAPKFAMNVGACARLAANYDLRDLAVCSPRCDIHSDDAQKLATGDGAQYLSRFKTYPTLKDAMSGCHTVIGFSRRTGEWRVPSVTVAGIPALAQEGHRVALVFGNEETGLSAEELSLCTHLCSLSTSDVLPSLNLSHAVAVVASRLFDDMSGPSGPVKAKKVAPVEELEGLISHWREFLIDIGLNVGGNPDRMMRRIRKILQRSSLASHEVNLFRGVLSKAQVALGLKSRGKRIG